MKVFWHKMRRYTIVLLFSMLPTCSQIHTNIVVFQDLVSNPPLSPPMPPLSGSLASPVRSSTPQQDEICQVRSTLC